ncbi:MAG: hypothetical protein ACK4GQ_00125 [Candidatus Hadarchaeales archaeon]
MRLIHYQTLEPVEPETLQQLMKIKERYNEGRSFWERIKLWRKSDILPELEPKDSRWGYSQVSSEEEKAKLLQTLKQMSEATPSNTWVIYDEGDGGAELVLRMGRVIAGTT